MMPNEHMCCDKWCKYQDMVMELAHVIKKIEEMPDITEIQKSGYILSFPCSKRDILSALQENK